MASKTFLGHFQTFSSVAEASPVKLNAVTEIREGNNRRFVGGNSGVNAVTQRGSDAVVVAAINNRSAVISEGNFPTLPSVAKTLAVNVPFVCAATQYSPT